MEGATPKLMASARLSSSAPKREKARNSLADKPSIISKHAATSTHNTAFCQSESKANLTPVRPVQRPIVVKILGRSLVKDSFLALCLIGLSNLFMQQIASPQMSPCHLMLQTIGSINNSLPQFSPFFLMRIRNS